MSTLIKDLTALLGTAAATTRWDGRVEEELARPLVEAGLARRTPAGTYLTPAGRDALPDGATARELRPRFDWGSDPYPAAPPAAPTVEDVRAYPAYWLCGPGRERVREEC
ncbi:MULTISPECIES: hypothetical protein [Nocardiopsis]|uniref:Uncharacterized protein n=1 Tax=Nocardiopsis dassonvillei (strain ATCC 23218 / DSM 43111 / CIP 107115 / JCM 7437 / KCTC 9190 / NBRC 14626 / NCTC 10488 / NRRL B-5397 / IMRU 509) TaxID=446468 RepID=D7B7V6_NOCDD|nr:MULTISPECIES: hypothetical protein [Nocardiopsis]ADH70264.1 hypothetical protein Ndas_4881 [Nocardiopsis dassonvillei subsp. dassonvillei DSM 43111]APC33559.1 hypothetical protein A9R04_02035 [Nocardiopsis dassonvillei]NKY79725.1 hypothetical protein [Nocardiopsis dassonvillei]VEI91171.1 Uncharacterised protein [Nocardiopsis dassonvillei]